MYYGLTHGSSGLLGSGQKFSRSNRVWVGPIQFGSFLDQMLSGPSQFWVGSSSVGEVGGVSKVVTSGSCGVGDIIEIARGNHSSTRDSREAVGFASSENGNIFSIK